MGLSIFFSYSLVFPDKDQEILRHGSIIDRCIDWHKEDLISK